MLIQLAVAMFAVQAGFHGFTASLPLAMARSGVPDPQIGLVMGAAALVQVPAAFLAGSLVDRFGGARLFVVGAGAYLVACGILAVAPDPTANLLPYLAARAIQGVGIAASIPAALSLIPALIHESRRGFGLALGGSAQNLTLVVMPPLSLVVLGRGRSVTDVAIASALIVVVGALLALAPAAAARQRQAIDAAKRGIAVGPARLTFSFRRAWALPLLLILLYVSHWGTITAYLPSRAEAAGADIGLFFVADGLAILVMRIPTGWVADRIQGRWLVLAGLVLSFGSVAILLLPPTTTVLVLSGLIGGTGGGLVITPVLVELSRRSDDRDRGSAFSLFSGALAGAIALGSVGAAPLIGIAGFEVTIVAGLVAIALAVTVAVADRGLSLDPRAGARVTVPGA